MSRTSGMTIDRASFFNREQVSPTSPKTPKRRFGVYSTPNDPDMPHEWDDRFCSIPSVVIVVPLRW